jgi:hypothetical protein
MYEYEAQNIPWRACDTARFNILLIMHRFTQSVTKTGVLKVVCGASRLLAAPIGACCQMSLAYGDIDAEERAAIVGCIPGTPPLRYDYYEARSVLVREPRCRSANVRHRDAASEPWGRGGRFDPAPWSISTLSLPSRKGQCHCRSPDATSSALAKPTTPDWQAPNRARQPSPPAAPPPRPVAAGSGAGLEAAAVSHLELWRVPVGRPEGEWSRLAAAALAAGAAGPPPQAPGAAGAAALPAAEGMGDIEDCPWHVSAPAHWDMYAYRLANAEPDL